MIIKRERGNWIEKTKAGFRWPSCPVTGGVPTRMTAEIFDLMCDRRRMAHLKKGKRGSANKNINCGQNWQGKTPCGNCSRRPAELQIIEH